MLIADLCSSMKFFSTLKLIMFETDMQDMWAGLLHHVTGEHEWALGACRHGPLVDSREKDWIVKNSPAQQKLREIIMDIRWLKNFHLSGKSTNSMWVSSSPFLCRKKT